ncbi:MAG: hypothetical protein HGA61_01455 [Candidatus Moranbacteria bacterium]|nr:hypothetical protein [Candidatus Moranbacteria bacterium]
MKKQNLVIIVVAGLILLSGSFYGGMQYGVKNFSKNQLVQNEKSVGGFEKKTNADGIQRMAGEQSGQRGMAGQGANANGGTGDFAGGEIISKDDTSVTIKTRDGGSKIIFFSAKTSIDKSVSGSIGDLSLGQQVTANGKASSDGSITAQNIQIRATQVSQPEN